MVRTIKKETQSNIIDINKYTVYSKLQPTYNGNDAHNIPNKDTLSQTAKKLKTELLYEQDTQKQQILHQKIYDINTDLNTISQIEARVATELPPDDNEAYLQYKRKLAEDEYEEEYVRGVVKTEKIKVQATTIEEQEDLIEEQEEVIEINTVCQLLQNNIRVCEYGEKTWDKIKQDIFDRTHVASTETQLKAELDKLLLRLTTCVNELKTAVANLPNKINYSNKYEYTTAYKICIKKWKAWKGKYGFRKLRHIWVKYSGVDNYDRDYWENTGIEITNISVTMATTIEAFNIHITAAKNGILQKNLYLIFDNMKLLIDFYNKIDRTSIHLYNTSLTTSITKLKKLKSDMHLKKAAYLTFINTIVDHNKIGILANIAADYDILIKLIENISKQFNREIAIYNDLPGVKQEYDAITPPPATIEIFLKNRLSPITTTPIPDVDTQSEDDIKTAMYEIQTKWITRPIGIRTTTHKTKSLIVGGGGSYQCAYFTIILFVILIVLIIILIYVIYVINTNKYNTNYILI